MADIHAVVRTDLMGGTDVRAGLVSIKYMGSGSEATDVDNGNVLKVDSLIDGEREIYKGVTPAAEDKVEDIVLIATPEVLYDATKRSLEHFYNEAGKICRGYRLHTNDIFSVTKEALEGSPSVGNPVTLKAGTKLEASGSGTEIGKIIAKETAGKYTYFVIKVGAPKAAAPVI